MKDKIIYFAKIAIGLGLVVWLLSKVDHAKIAEYFISLNARTIILIIILTLCTLSVQFLRWWYLIKTNSDNFEFKDILPSFFAGFALRLMIPGGHAEFSKIFLMPGRKRGKAVAFGMEKFFQTYIKLLLIFAILPLTFSQYKWYSYSALIILIIVFVFLPRLKWLTMLQERKVNNLIVFGITFLYSMSIFAIMVLQYYILLNQVHEIELWQTAHTVVYLWSAGIVPISISGLGIREGLAVYFLNNYGFPPAYAVSTSLFLFFLNIIIPAITGVYFLYQKHGNFREVKQTVKSTKSILKKIREGNGI